MIVRHDAERGSRVSRPGRSLQRARVAWLLAFALLAAPVPLGAAHEVDQSYVFLTVRDNVISGRFEITAGDLNRVLGLDFRTDGSVTLEEVTAHIDAIRAYLLSRVRFEGEAGPRTIELGDHRLYDVSFAQFVSIDFTLDPFPAEPLYLDVTWNVGFEGDPDHRGLLVIENNWKTGTFNEEANVALIFSPRSTQQRLDLTSSSVWRGFTSLVELGTHHIWIGIDHILFLVALLLPAVLRREDGKWVPVPGFRPALINVIKIVTLFTIAHSVTLSLAALEVVRLPSRFVESVIAASIAAAALHVIVPVFKTHVLWVVFLFGLFHGFGFASVLGTLGIPGKYMAVSLLGFNVGVEIGQVAIVCLILPVLFVVRRSRAYSPYAVNLGAGLLILISMYWFLERAFAVDIPTVALVRRVLGS